MALGLQFVTLYLGTKQRNAVFNMVELTFLQAIEKTPVIEEHIE